METQTYIGYLTAWYKLRGYGFIAQVGTPTESFVHVSDVVGGDAPKINDKVEFQIIQFKDKTKAVNVRVIE